MANTPFVGYENLFLSDNVFSVAATNEATDFPKENGYDWLTYDWWKPGATGDQYLTFTFTTPQNANYFACFSHNLGSTGASITLQRESSPSVWDDTFTPVSPSDTEVVFKEISEPTGTKWRVELGSCTVDTMVGVLTFGAMLKFTEGGMRVGFAPPDFDRDIKSINNFSVEGALLGRSFQQKSRKLLIQADGISPSWMRTKLEAFLDHAETLPFFVAWDDTNYPAEAAYCWATNGIDRQVYSDPNYMRLRLQCDALVK